MIRTAILVDGGFYRKRTKFLWGEKIAQKRADELVAYCKAHLEDPHDSEEHRLYRVFYYYCAPISRKTIYHPLTKKNVDLEKSDTYAWATSFMEELKKKRKFALHLGHLSDQVFYNLKPNVTKELLSGKRTLDDLAEADFSFTAQQKGVDMKIGVDIASLAYKHGVDKIILIAGDSDFVPAAKLARLEGIDFVLDPWGASFVTICLNTSMPYAPLGERRDRITTITIKQYLLAMEPANFTPKCDKRWQQGIVLSCCHLFTLYIEYRS